MEAKRGQPEGDEWWHGTPGGYTNHRCRGPRCRSAQAADVREDRQRRARETPFDKIPHGAGGYTNYQCRCDVCGAAHTAQRAANRAKGT